MSQRWPYFLIPLCVLTGCASVPDSYAPPVQRKPMTGADPSPVGQFVNMVESNSDAYVVRDVMAGAPNDPWRWTRKRPELRFYLDSVDNLNFIADFTIAEATFKDTGPVVVSIFINGKLLDKVDCKTSGERRFSKPVPPELLHPKALNFAALEIDKLWVSPTDGAQLGLILIRAGFKP